MRVDSPSSSLPKSPPHPFWTAIARLHLRRCSTFDLTRHRSRSPLNVVRKFKSAHLHHHVCFYAERAQHLTRNTEQHPLNLEPPANNVRTRFVSRKAARGIFQLHPFLPASSRWQRPLGGVLLSLDRLVNIEDPAAPSKDTSRQLLPPSHAQPLLPNPGAHHPRLKSPALSDTCEDSHRFLKLVAT